MTKITTETNRGPIILSWIIALAVCGGMFLWFWLAPPIQQGAIHFSPTEHQSGQTNKHKKTAQQLQHTKAEQAKRPLPREYADQLLKQSEEVVKRNLEMELKKFEEMTMKMRRRKNALLTQVEGRKLPSGAPRDANNTKDARNIPQAPNSPLGPDANVEAIYNRLRAYELETQKNHLAVNAAKQALTQGLSFPEVYHSLQLGSSLMATFNELIKNQTHGQAWQRSANSQASAGLQIRNTGDLNNYRGLLGQASRQAGLAGARMEGLFGRPGSGRDVAFGQGDGNGQGGGGYGQGGGGNGFGFGNGEADMGYGNGKNNNPISRYEGPRLNQDMVRAQALPGRRFSKAAARQGWLYVNTWYMIGPWENYGRDDFAIVHPPEVSIDFDAVYTDGQKGMGVAEVDSDPLKIIGDDVRLDGTLRWKFMQSESMHNTVPVTTGNSTYYAYTELYFDEAATMLVAIGTDDGGRLWINGKDVWQDRGTSWYYIDEHIAPFHFQQGWNRVLIRLENSGGGPTGFSFLICPKGAVNSAMLDR